MSNEAQNVQTESPLNLTSTATQITNDFDWHITNEEILATYPQLSKNESKVIVVGRNENLIDKNGNEYISLTVAQKTVIKNVANAQQRASAFLLGGAPSSLLRANLYVKPEVAAKFKNGATFPDNMNLERQESLTPFYQGQEPVLNPVTGEETHYYRQNVLVEGEPNHWPRPAKPEADL